MATIAEKLQISLAPLAPITTAATALANLILVSPQATIGYQPQNPPGPDGTPSKAQQPPSFLFNYEGEQTLTLDSDITDHFIEDNTAIQDQIALRPEIVSTNGFIAELNDIPPPALALAKQIANKLLVIGAYTPDLTTTGLIAYNEAFFLYQVGANAVDAAVSAWSSINNIGSGQSVIANGQLKKSNNQNKQQTAFQQFYGFWRERRLFTVQTPWAVLQNMAIKSLQAIQDESTRVITDFKVSFKAVRIASTITVGGAQTPQLSGQAATQTPPVTDLGTATPPPSISVGQGLTQMGAP